MAEPVRRPVWLDCDPGHDDAFALLLAGHHASLELLGVSTVAGNQTLDNVTRNALRVLHCGGLGAVRVAKGAAKPLLGPPKTCPEIHGESGLDGPEVPCATREPEAAAAITVMAEAIKGAAKQGERVVLVCTGALTNAALLLAVYPELVEVVEVVFMGGALGQGNTGPVQEFNIMIDPHAAQMVLQAGCPVTMVPLEVTHTVLVTPGVLDRVGTASPFRQLMSSLLTFFAESYSKVFGFRDPPLHDPVAVAYVVAPHLFQTRRLRVDVECASPLSFGQTVCDVWAQSGNAPNCTVATAVDVEGFWDLQHAAIAAADAASPMNSR